MVTVHDELQMMWKEAGEACFSIPVSWVEGQKKTATNQSYIALPYLDTSAYHELLTLGGIGNISILPNSLFTKC
jgi:hypothetical protein